MIYPSTMFLTWKSIIVSSGKAPISTLIFPDVCGIEMCVTIHLSIRITYR